MCNTNIYMVLCSWCSGICILMVTVQPIWTQYKTMIKCCGSSYTKEAKAYKDSLALEISLEHTNFCHEMTSCPASSKLSYYGWLGLTISHFCLYLNSCALENFQSCASMLTPHDFDSSCLTWGVITHKLKVVIAVVWFLSVDHSWGGSTCWWHGLWNTGKVWHDWGQHQECCFQSSFQSSTERRRWAKSTSQSSNAERRREYDECCRIARVASRTALTGEGNAGLVVCCSDSALCFTHSHACTYRRAWGITKRPWGGGRRGDWEDLY